MSAAEKVYMVFHEHEMPDGCEDHKTIGIYHTEADAAAAIARVRNLPGFVESPEGFDSYEVTIGEDAWTSGFFTDVVPPASSEEIIHEFERDEDKALLDIAWAEQKELRLRATPNGIRFLAYLFLALHREGKGVKLERQGLGQKLFVEKSAGLRIEIVSDLE